MRKTFLLSLCLCLSFFQMETYAQLPTPSTASLNAMQVGVVAAIKGKVEIVDEKQVGKVVQSGEAIFMGDEVRTGPKGQLQIMLLDETVFTIGPKSSMIIDEFVYDPATANGKIDVRVIEGAFRLITGKIGEKKPKNVNIQLPVGSVGIRGTIVYGKVEGESSKLLLLGPGSNNNTQDKVGAIIVENETSDGKTESTEINKSGFSTTIPGVGQAPTNSVLLSEAETQEMIGALGGGEDSEDQDEEGQETSSSASKSSDSSSNEDDDLGADDNVSDDAGQSTAGAIDVADDVGDLGDFGDDLSDDVLDSIQDSLDDDDSKGVFDGIATLNNLDFAIENNLLQGKVKYQSTGNSLLKDGGNTGTFSFYIVVNFDDRTIGGDSSQVTANHPDISSNLEQLYSINSETWEAASVDAENANFSFKDIMDTGTASCSTCLADIVISLHNVDGEVADLGVVSLNISGSGIDLNGTASAERQEII